MNIPLALLKSKFQLWIERKKNIYVIYSKNHYDIGTKQFYSKYVNYLSLFCSLNDNVIILKDKSIKEIKVKQEVKSSVISNLCI